MKPLVALAVFLCASLLAFQGFCSQDQPPREGSPGLVWRSVRSVSVQVAVQGGPGEAVRDVVRDRLDELEACYDRTLEKKPDAEGELVLQFRIASDGSPRSVRQTGGDLSDRSLGQCVTEGLRRWRFPAAYTFVEPRVTLVVTFQGGKNRQ